MPSFTPASSATVLRCYQAPNCARQEPEMYHSETTASAQSRPQRFQQMAPKNSNKYQQNNCIKKPIIKHWHTCTHTYKQNLVWIHSYCFDAVRLSAIAASKRSKSIHPQHQIPHTPVWERIFEKIVCNAAKELHAYENLKEQIQKMENNAWKQTSTVNCKQTKCSTTAITQHSATLSLFTTGIQPHTRLQHSSEIQRS